MKGICRKLLLVCTLFTLFASILIAEPAIVTSVKGKVEVNHGGDTWVPLALGDQVSESDVVSTGFQSEVRIKYNGSVMLLGALTRVTLNQMSSTSSADKVDVFLNTGAVRSKVTHTDDRKVSYNVRGPVAVASVRGTDFTCFANGNVMCFEGAVAVYPARNFVEAENANTDAEAEEESEETEESDETAETGSTVESETQTETAVEAEPAVEVAEETNTKAEEPAPAPAPVETAKVDEGPAKATTPAQEISEVAPAGAVVVAQNQETTFTATGKASKPLEVSTTNISKAKTQVSTAAAKEAVNTGTTTEVPQQVEPVVRKGSLALKLVFQDDVVSVAPAD